MANLLIFISQENIPSSTEDAIVQDMEASAAASQFHKQIKEKYNIGMAIAEGKFVAVKHCSDKQDNKEFLLRVIHKARVFGKDDKILQEIDIMRMIRHENVLMVQDYWESTDEVCMVMEPIEVISKALAIKYSYDDTNNQLTPGRRLI